MAQGLGFRVPLDRQQAVNGFARVVVLGLRLSAGAAQGAAMLEELIANHQYSPKGFSLVAQGTPTNNTERDGSGYSDNDPVRRPAVLHRDRSAGVRSGRADERVESQTDGRLLADALGISYAALQSVPNADADRRARSARDEHGAVSLNARLLAEDVDGTGGHARRCAPDARFFTST